MMKPRSDLIQKRRVERFDEPHVNDFAFNAFMGQCLCSLLRWRDHFADGKERDGGSRTEGFSFPDLQSIETLFHGHT